MWIWCESFSTSFKARILQDQRRFMEQWRKKNWNRCTRISVWEDIIRFLDNWGARYCQIKWNKNWMHSYLKKKPNRLLFEWRLVRLIWLVRVSASFRLWFQEVEYHSNKVFVFSIWALAFKNHFIGIMQRRYNSSEQAIFCDHNKTPILKRQRNWYEKVLWP